jgi:integrase/recombinase XerD
MELKRLLSVAYDHNKHHHMALLTCFWQGCRVSELLSIRWCDISDGQLTIRRLKGAGKPGKKRHKTTVHALHADPDPVFHQEALARGSTSSVDLVFPWCRQRMDQIIKRYGKLAGLHPKKCHMHVLRHSLAVLLWRETHEISAVQQILGHWSPSSSLIYMQTDAKDKASAVLAKGFSA